MLARSSWGLWAALVLFTAACGSGGDDTTASGAGAGSTGAGASSTGAGAGSSTGSTSSGTGAGGPGGAGACSVFPADNWWNTPIAGLDVDPLSDDYVASIGAGSPFHPDFGTAYGIPFQDVDGSVAKSPVIFGDEADDESDVGPYPIPANPIIEEGGDHHLLMVHTDECVLYELFAAELQGDGWHAYSGAIWDLKKNSTRPAGWTSADAAGLPIYPGLVRYEEAVIAGEIKHALRFTAPDTQHAYVAPASHFASDDTDPSLPPMGVRMRLKKDFDISGYPKVAQVILTALQTYGMFLADNGSSWFVSGAPDPRWNDEDLDSLKQLQGSDFEAVVTGPLTTRDP